MQAAPPLEKHVVLVGAGNAHIVFSRMFGMEPFRGVAVTLVCEAPAVPYSAMVPGHIGGEYGREALTIDLVRACRAFGVRLVAARATGIDTMRRAVLLEGRPEIRYDVVSLGVGSMPSCPPGLEGLEKSWKMRPLGRTLDRLEALETSLASTPRPVRFVVAGGGASGCELAAAIRKRFSRFAGFSVSLFQANERLLPTMTPKASRLFEESLRRSGVEVRLGARITGGDGTAISVEGGDPVPYDVLLWATEATPPELIRTCGLPLGPSGFLRVRPTLQSVANDSVFGTGDCIQLESHPDLAKNGVYAVREGRVLFHNVGDLLHERPLRPFVPQPRCRLIFNTADGEAILNWGPFAWKSAGARRLKKRIDDEWMRNFTEFPAMAAAEGGEAAEPEMRCGGCGSKISSDVLSAVLRRLDPGADPRLIIGARDAEDAAVHRMRPELFGKDASKVVEVQTVDFFKTFTDDPFLFGRITALHAISDIYAMGARPFSALAMATLPLARGPIQESMLFELLSGALATFRECGVVLAGGHTTEGPDLALGFTVTGHGEEDALLRKGGLRAGDSLILTKALGTGALLAAWARARCPAPWYDAALRSMLLAGARAAEILRAHGCRACTDITGFGFAGHLLEMLDASALSARIEPKSVPLLPGFAEVSEGGILSTLHPDNAKVSSRITGADTPPAWLFDPQTSGGLLAGVPGEAAAECVRKLREAGYVAAAVVGEATDGKPPEVVLGR
jgi:selenide,water dikinase